MGFAVFVLASFLCIGAPSIEKMVVGRILQGIGLSASRSISIAMIRDRFEGDYMAKIMSFVVTIFILVPIIAPTLGKFLLDKLWLGIYLLQSVIIWYCSVVLVLEKTTRNTSSGV